MDSLSRSDPARPHPDSTARVAVVSLDGVPHSLLTRLIADGAMPTMARLVAGGEMIRFDSVRPTISSVAWATYMTGVNPGRHGIYGFIDRTLSPLKMFIPTARNMQAETLWSFLGRHGHRVVVINVPVTYPPQPVNGVLVGGFLGADSENFAWPREISRSLAGSGYVVDVDPWLGRQDDRGPFLDALTNAVDRRFEAALHLMESEAWEYFHCHVMETDRLMHFLWGPYEAGHPQYRQGFLDLFRRIDDRLGRFVDRLPADTTLIMLSDHGFCGVKREVQLNRWLQEEGYLTLAEADRKGLGLVAPESRAYSLIPGRVFINLQGREPNGRVRPGIEYEELRVELAERLTRGLTAPQGDDAIIDRVFLREELYHGPLLERAADLVAVPRDGYDLKSRLNPDRLFEQSELSGMHTFDDAFLYIRGQSLSKDDGASIIDLFPSIAAGLFGLDLEELQLEGRSLIETP